MENKRQKIGRKGEALARLYLQLHGYTILDKNYRTKAGELDIIAKKGDCIVFVEVKTRTNREYGAPAEAVTYEKQQHMLRSAQYYLMKVGFDRECRFDVIEVMLSQKTAYFFPIIHHLKNVIQ